jgi:hypothetical protein
VVVTIVLAVAGVVLGLAAQPGREGSLATGGLIALTAVLVGTPLAAIAGGKAGAHFHRKVDRVGLP